MGLAAPFLEAARVRARMMLYYRVRVRVGARMILYYTILRVRARMMLYYTILYSTRLCCTMYSWRVALTLGRGTLLDYAVLCVVGG